MVKGLELRMLKRLQMTYSGGDVVAKGLELRMLKSFQVTKWRRCNC